MSTPFHRLKHIRGASAYAEDDTKTRTHPRFGGGSAGRLALLHETQVLLLPDRCSLGIMGGAATGVLSRDRCWPWQVILR